MTSPQPTRSALNTHDPFTRSQARAAGIGVKALLGGLYQRVFYDLYVSTEVAITPALRARAALRVAGPGAYASHHTAAELWDAPAPNDTHTHVTVPERGQRCTRQGIKSHLRNPAARITMRRGIPLSTPEQAFLDLAAAGVCLVDLVVVGDMLLKAGHTTRLELIEQVEAWTGPGRVLANRAARLVREHVDSPMETRLRLLLVFAGLPEPQINLILRAEDGSWRMRFDMCFPEQRVLIEYDGRQHAESTSQWERDIYRREELDRMGYRLLIVTSRGIYVEPQRTLKRVRELLIERGVPGVRPRFRTTWQRHFPQTGIPGGL